MQSLLFLIGRIRTKEGQLLSRNVWQRFSEAESFAAWVQQLRDTPYADVADHTGTFEQFETALARSFQQLKAELFSVQHFDFEPLLWRKYDIHTIKLLLKMRFGHKDLHASMIKCGELSFEQLEAFIVRNENLGLPLHWIQVIHKAEEIFKAHDRSYSAMDTYLDSVLYEELRQTAEPWGSNVQRFVEQQIDEANFKLWWFSLKKPGTINAFLDGGTRSQDFLKKHEGVNVEELIKQLFPGLTLAQPIDEALLQRELDDRVSRHLFNQRFTSQGVLPVLVFFRAKELEIKNLKTFYLQKAKNYQKLSDYVRETYA